MGPKFQQAIFFGWPTFVQSVYKTISVLENIPIILPGPIRYKADLTCDNRARAIATYPSGEGMGQYRCCALWFEIEAAF